jgi:Putative MetA-pathway of phenol degradation
MVIIVLMNKIILSIAITFFTTMISIAQNRSVKELPAIQTDRPDQTECPFLTPIGWLQVESGAILERLSTLGSPSNINQITSPTILTKYGINKNFELRLVTDYSIVRTNNTILQQGVPPIILGLKAKLLESKGIIPNAAVICHLGFPSLSSDVFTTKSIAPSYRFLMMHPVSDKLNISYNLGHEWSGNDDVATFIYTFSTGYSFSNKIGGYIEVFGFVPDAATQDHRFDGGFTYLFNNNNQLDISAGLGISGNSPPYYVSIGYSFRTKVR